MVAYQLIHSSFCLCLCVKPIMTQNNPNACLIGVYSLVEGIEVNPKVTLINILPQIEKGYENEMHNKSLFFILEPRKL